MSPIHPLAWRTLSSEITFQDRWLTVRSDECLTPKGARIGPYHVIGYPDWVNVVAVRADGKLVLALEYRHGAGEVVLGLPSGAIDARDGGDPAEAARVAAERELAEETGYGGVAFERVLGAWPNPANQSNRATTFLALGVRETGGLAPDLGEEIEVVLEDWPQVMRRLARGELVMQAMHIAGLWAAATRVLLRGTGLAPEVLKDLRAAVAGD
jgi:ADP-ribose pyrophosphatase